MGVVQGYLVEQTERSPIDYLQYVDETVAPVMFDSMIQINQDHKRVSGNIEATKEKMANKKRKLLKA
nr:recombinase RecU [Bacillus sp. JAS24-2]